MGHRDSLNTENITPPIAGVTGDTTYGVYGNSISGDAVVGSGQTGVGVGGTSNNSYCDYSQNTFNAENLPKIYLGDLCSAVKTRLGSYQRYT